MLTQQVILVDQVVQLGVTVSLEGLVNQDLALFNLNPSLVSDQEPQTILKVFSRMPKETNTPSAKVSKIIINYLIKYIYIDSVNQDL